MVLGDAPPICRSVVGEASDRGVRAGSIFWIGSPIILTRCPAEEGTRRNVVEMLGEMLGEWSVNGGFLNDLSLNIHQHPSTSINIHQYPSTSINIHQYPSISINIHQVNGGFHHRKSAHEHIIDTLLCVIQHCGLENAGTT
jgi:hypothetical protein